MRVKAWDLDRERTPVKHKLVNLHRPGLTMSPGTVYSNTVSLPDVTDASNLPKQLIEN